MTSERWNVGVLLFDGVALLDVAGPFEVLNRARLEPGVESRHREEEALFEVFTVAKTQDPVTATGGIVLVPRHSFADAPRIDLLLVPGGFGTRPVLQDAETIDWIRRTAASARQDGLGVHGRPPPRPRRPPRRAPGHHPLGQLRAASPRWPGTSRWTARRASSTTAS